MLDKIPYDVLLANVFMCLDGPSLLDLSLVSKYFNNLINNDECLWKKLCAQEFNISRDNAYRYKGWKKFYLALRANRQHLYIWGENFDGRLGLPDQSIDSIPISDQSQDRLIYPIVRRGPIKVTTPFHLSTLDNKSIIDIVVGGWSFHALDTQGHVWTWGAMQQGISSRFSIGTKRLEKPTLVQTNNVLFKSISSGRGHVIGLAKDGSVWHWSNHVVIQKVSFHPVDVKIAQVVANWDYSSLLSEDGAIYIVPRPQFITTHDMERDPEPTEVITIRRGIQAQDLDPSADYDDTIVQIAGLKGFTLALTRYGKVYKINTEDPLDMTSVQLTHFSSYENEYNDRHGAMKRFITGAYNNFAVYTKDHTVLLGNVHADKETKPNRIPELDNQEICKVTFGDYHFGALTSHGKVLTWGSFSSGALGHGKLANNRDYAPKVVDSLNDKFVFAIGFGGWQSAALAL